MMSRTGRSKACSSCFTRSLSRVKRCLKRDFLKSPVSSEMDQEDSFFLLNPESEWRLPLRRKHEMILFEVKIGMNNRYNISGSRVRQTCWEEGTIETDWSLDADGDEEDATRLEIQDKFSNLFSTLLTSFCLEDLLPLKIPLLSCLSCYFVHSIRELESRRKAQERKRKLFLDLFTLWRVVLPFFLIQKTWFSNHDYTFSCCCLSEDDVHLQEHYTFCQKTF
jgi:hypothetical protein